MLKPLGKRLVIEVAPAEEKTVGGLILSSAAQEKQETGTVLAVSKEVASAGEVAVGDRVVFESYAGATVKQDGQEYLVIELDHVLAVLG
ncbi:co-chaperone GroES [Abiotrophia defectiva]